MNTNSFVIAYEDYNPYAYGPEILAYRFTDTPGNVDTNLADAQYISVASPGAGLGSSATHPSIAMSPDGYFDIAHDVTNYGGHKYVMDSRYFFTGALEATFNITTPDQPGAQHAAVARDDLGNAVVAYEKWEGSGWGIFAQRINSGDVQVPGEIYVQDAGQHEHDPSVVMAPPRGVGGGQFAVAYDTLNASGGSAVEVAVISSQATGNVRSEVLGGFDGFYSNVSVDASGHMKVTYSRQTGPAKTDVFVRRGTLDGFPQVGGDGIGSSGGDRIGWLSGAAGARLK
jgi:hypothetical protein